MRRMQRLLLFMIGPLALLTAILWRATYQEVRQARINQALIAAAHNGDADAVSALLEEGADANAREQPVPSISFKRMVYELLRRRNSSQAGQTALLAAMNGLSEHHRKPQANDPANFPQVIADLLDQGASPNVVDSFEEAPAPLMIAANLGYAKLTLLLLDHGAQVNMESSSHDTALIWAIRGNEPGCARLLLARGADVNRRDDGGNNALISAADLDDLDLVRLLLDHGADPKAVNNAGTGALSLLVRHGDTAGVKLLLSQGADPKNVDRMGRTCLFWLRGKPHSEIAALLHAAGAGR